MLSTNQTLACNILVNVGLYLKGFVCVNLFGASITDGSIVVFVMNKKIAQMELEQAKKEAEKEKNVGNEYFKATKFGPAIQHYTKAIELDPTNAVRGVFKLNNC